jgi:hypothetical protein
MQEFIKDSEIEGTALCCKIEEQSKCKGKKIKSS